MWLETAAGVFLGLLAFKVAVRVWSAIASTRQRPAPPAVQENTQRPVAYPHPGGRWMERPT